MDPSGNKKGVLLFDWGNTLMKVFPDQSGPMKTWTKIEVMPHVRETLNLLHPEWIIAIATNAENSSEEDIREVLRNVDLLSSVDKIYCYRNIGFKKPSRDFFHYILQDLNIEPEKIIMIGDDYQADVQGARNNQIRAIWYNPGRKTVPDHQPVDQFGDFRKLQDLLKQVNLQ